MKKEFQRISLDFKKLTVVLFALVLFFNGYAQNAVMRSGKQLERKDFKDNSLRYNDFVSNRGFLNASSVIFSPDKEASIGFSSEKKGSYNFIVFQDYINYKEIREINAEVPTKSEVILNALVKINDKNFLVYSQYTKSNRQTVMYVNEMSNTNVLLGSPIKVLTIGEEKNSDYGLLHVKVSANKKSILIYQSTEGSGKDARKMSCHVIDPNFSVVWQNDFDFKLPEKEVTIHAVDIDDDGNLYALVYKGKEKRQKAAVLSYAWKSKSFKETSVGRADEKAKTYGCLLKVVDGVRPTVAGISTLEDDLTYFVVSFDPKDNSSKELLSSGFPDKEKSQLITKKNPEEWLSVTRMVRTANNNLVLSFESSHQLLVSSSQSVSHSYYYSGSIFVVSVGSNGIAWSNIISKSQIVLINPFITGHSLIADGDNVLVFYNDRDTNVGKGEDDKEGKTYKGINTALIMQKINSLGKMTSQPIVTGQEDKFGINPDYFVKISDKLYHTQLFALTFTKFACAYATIELR